MSIGTVIADSGTFEPIEVKHHILPTECEIGGMYYDTLFIETPVNPILCTRSGAIADLRLWLQHYGVQSIFSYNTCFDRNHLPELRDFDWHDIMRLAAFRQHNPKIPATADCYSTGRLKHGYDVEPMRRLLSRNRTYRESHNAFYNALDELKIMQLLNHRFARLSPIIIPAQQCAITLLGHSHSQNLLCFSQALVLRYFSPRLNTVFHQHISIYHIQRHGQLCA